MTATTLDTAAPVGPKSLRIAGWTLSGLFILFMLFVYGPVFGGFASIAMIVNMLLVFAGISVLGSLPRHAPIKLPERHLGLVQAAEHSHLNEMIGEAARLVTERVDLDALLQLAECTWTAGAKSVVVWHNPRVLTRAPLPPRRRSSTSARTRCDPAPR